MQRQRNNDSHDGAIGKIFAGILKRSGNAGLDGEGLLSVPAEGDGRVFVGPEDSDGSVGGMSLCFVARVVGYNHCRLLDLSLGEQKNERFAERTL